MSYARFLIYLVGLALVVLAGWIFLTQTDIGRTIPTVYGLIALVLVVGLGIMASAKAIREETHRVVHEGTDTRVVHEGGGTVAPTYREGPPSESVEYRDPATGDIVRERRYRPGAP